MALDAQVRLGFLRLTGLVRDLMRGPGRDLTGPLSILWAALANRGNTRVIDVQLGSSTPAGSGASATSRRWYNLLIAQLQAAYPNPSGSEIAPSYSTSATFNVTATAGLVPLNAAESGTTSSTFLTDDEISRIAALNPSSVRIGVGANDWRNGVSVASYKATLAERVDALRAAIGVPCVITLVHHHERYDATPGNGVTWAQYGDALREIAAARPQQVAFIDVSDEFRTVGVPSADPFGLMASDKIHLADRGHAFLSDLVCRAMGVTPRAIPPVPTASDTAAPTVSSFTATGGDGQVALSWAASDNVGVTRYVLKRATPAATLLDGTGTSFSDTARTNGTRYDYTLDVYDAAGNTVQASAFATPAASALPTMTNTAAPSIAPTSATAGQVLTVTDGTWNPTPDSIARQWRRDGVDISGQTGTSYTTTSADAGKAITCAEVPTKSGYQTGAAVVSNSVTVAAAGPTVYASDNFDRSDGALGSTPVGSYPWQQSFNGQYAIVSGKAKPSNSNGGQSMWIDDGQLNGTLKAVVTEVGSGFLFRATNGVGYYLIYSSSAGVWRYGKITGANAFTALKASSAMSFTANSAIEVVMNGSAFTIKVNGTTVITATDTSYTGTQHGILTLSASNTVDQFEHNSAT